MFHFGKCALLPNQQIPLAPSQKREPVGWVGNLCGLPGTTGEEMKGTIQNWIPVWAGESE